MLDRIEQDTIQLDSMLERILTVARLENGQYKPKFESLSLNDVIDEVLDDARFEAAATDATDQLSRRCDARGQRRSRLAAQRHRERRAQCHLLFGTGRHASTFACVSKRVTPYSPFATTARVYRKMRCLCSSSPFTAWTTPAATIDGRHGIRTGDCAQCRRRSRRHRSPPATSRPTDWKWSCVFPLAGTALPPRNSAAQLIAPLQGKR